MQRVCAEYLYLLFTQVVSARLNGESLSTKLVPVWQFHAGGVIINPSSIRIQLVSFSLAFHLLAT